MTRTTKILLGTAAAVAIGGGALAFSGIGGQSLNTAKLELISAAAASGGFHGHHRGRGLHRICSERRGERLDDAIGFVEAFFSFNDAQKTAWDGLATALRDGSDAIGKRCETIGETSRATTATGKLARVETMLTAGLEVVQTVRPAFDRFYATLDDDQRAALDRLIERRGHGRGER